MVYFHLFGGEKRGSREGGSGREESLREGGITWSQSRPDKACEYRYHFIEPDMV